MSPVVEDNCDRWGLGLGYVSITSNVHTDQVERIVLNYNLTIILQLHMQKILIACQLMQILLKFIF